MIWFLPWEESNDVKHVHWMLYALIALNVGVFVYMVTADAATIESLYRRYGLVADDLHWYQFLTGNFLHGGLMHLLGNMVFLYLFGDNVEDVLGPLGFLVLYLIGGLVGDIVFIANNGATDIPSIGASGCIAAIAGAYAVMFPTKPCSVRVMLLVFPIYTVNLYAIWMLLLWFGSDIAQTFASHGKMDGAGVNFVAHGIGFVFGACTALVARIHGVMRRYDAMPVGHALLGYWPSDMEAAFKREQRLRAARERGFIGQARTPAARGERKWR